jgi:hypothetical protein
MASLRRPSDRYVAQSRVTGHGREAPDASRVTVPPTADIRSLLTHVCQLQYGLLTKGKLPVLALSERLALRAIAER